MNLKIQFFLYLLGVINSLLGLKDLARSSTGYEMKTFAAV